MRAALSFAGTRARLSRQSSAAGTINSISFLRVETFRPRGIQRLTAAERAVKRATRRSLRFGTTGVG